MAVHLARLLFHRQAFDADMAGQRLVQPGNAAHQRGFACAIGADQRGHAACGDGDTDPIQCAVAGILEHQL